MPSRMLGAIVLFAAAPFVAGCNSGSEYREFTPQDDVTNTTPDHGHEHAAHGPNGGHLIELGDEQYHGEVVMDAATRKITVYVLGSDAKTAQPIGETTVALNLKVGETPTPLTLTAAPLEGEAEGQASRFELAGESVPEAIHDEEDLHGDLVVTIDGQQFRGEISHDHGHDHGHDHAHEGEAAHP